ncbi:hypothetical protein CQZ76_00855 [Anaplasma marginale]|nr:hypothetical protein CQZ76_00855 [Anaplasma marginale]
MCCGCSGECYVLFYIVNSMEQAVGSCAQNELTLHIGYSGEEVLFVILSGVMATPPSRYNLQSLLRYI